MARGNRVGARRLGAQLIAAVVLVGAGALPVAAATPARQTGIAQPRAQSVRLGGPAAQQLPTAPDTTGTWSPVMDWGLQAKHMAALPTGKVLVWSTGDNASVWDPGSSSFTPAPALFGDLHCAGQAMLADGRVIVVGGQNVSPHNGTSVTSLFDPLSSTWTRGPDMSYLRWYATSTTLADGRNLATSGDAPDGTRATIPEVYDPAANTWTKLTGAPRAQALYPLMFVLPDKRVYEAGPGAATAILDPTGTGSWTPGPSNSYSTSGYSESAVMYAPGKIMRAGGGDPAMNRVSVIDMTAASPAWRDVAPMAFARRRMNLVILADGSVMAIGGTRAADDATQAVLEGEIWNPATEQWTTVGAMTEPRMYHSAAVLLADGRIVVGGGEAAGRLRAQVYSPPYLFMGPRPVITAAPAMAGYATSFSISTPDAASITSVALIRLSAGTHAFDQNQRYVPLAFTAGTGSLSVTSPASGGVAPPGYYQLVIKNGNGVPSVASFIRVDTGGNLQPGSIHGTITDSATGLPIASATASIGSNVATSSANGAYTLSNVAAGDHTVQFVATGYATVTRNQTVVAGGSFQLDVAMAPPGSVSGVVRDATTNAAIAGATITYPGGETTTDANGAYSISPIASGPQLIAASAPGYSSAQQSVNVPAGSGATLDFALAQSATFLTGGVSDLVTSQPIAGAVVRYSGGSTTTDALGRYRFDVAPGTYTLTASAPGYDPLSHDAIVSAGTYAVTDFGLSVTAASSTLAIQASADSYVSLASPSKNYGTATTLRIRSGTTASPGTYVTYLRFPVSGLAGRSVSTAKIHLFNVDASGDGGQVFAAGDGWTETGITWSNAPATVGSSLGSVGAVTLNTWVDISLPGTAFPTDGSYTLALFSHSTNSALYSSRTGTNKPELDLTLGSGSPPPPPPPPPPAAPVAAFTVSPSTGAAPLPVTVTDTSTGSPTSWAWDFGDGTGSGLAAPATHTYANAGTFTIGLTVSNANGSSSTTHQVTVTSSPPPPPPPPPPPSSGIAGLTFESGRLVDPATGADKISGPVVLETLSPLDGTTSARVSNSTAAYLEKSWAAADDVYIVADIRFATLPTVPVRVLLLSDQGTSAGSLQLQITGALRLRDGSTTVGLDSAKLVAGTTYRIGIHQKRGTGANAVLEAFLAADGAAFTSPFAAKSNGAWTTAADRLRIGATAGGVLDLTMDDVLVDGAAMPTASASIALAAANAPLVFADARFASSSPRFAAATVPYAFVCSIY